jgi:twitching motility protein PilT
MDIDELLNYTVSHNASDLHLSSGVAPIVRIDEDLRPIEGAGILDESIIKSMMLALLPEQYESVLADQLDIDLGLGSDELKARFRINIFHQNRGISVAIRYLPLTPPTLTELNLPNIFNELCETQNGLILVTGPTGSGKSTTLAAMIDFINRSKSSHVLTIEDPIEYIHECKKCLVQQREVKKHTNSFDNALRAALREDPDYILVGEMRDLETIRLALTAAETGHLVFATLHTNSAADSIDRIVDVFPTHEKSLIRAMLANSLKAVVAQRLLKKIGGGRVAADEVMLCNTAVRNLIRENKTAQIYSAIQTGKESGMRTLAQHVQELIDQELIDGEMYSQLTLD